MSIPIIVIEATESSGIKFLKNAFFYESQNNIFYYYCCDMEVLK